MYQKTEQEIMKSWKGDVSRPIVSIQCLTYNHEAYIEAAIAGFLMQETNFPFEVIIHDDASTDKTAEVIKKYEQKYPHIFKPIYQTENKFQSGKKEEIRNAIHEKMRGRYIALCEGDDYWTDPKKLQQQVDYLEAHPECVITYTAVEAFDENGPDLTYAGGILYDVAAETLQKTVSINTPTVCFRRIIEELPSEHLLAGAADLFVWSLLGNHGSGHFIETIRPTRYRKHGGGIHSGLTDDEKNIHLIESHFALMQYYKKIDNAYLQEYFEMLSYKVAETLYKAHDEETVKELFKASKARMAQRVGSTTGLPLDAYDIYRDLDAMSRRLYKKSVGYLNHPFESQPELHAHSRQIDGFKHLDRHRLIMLWQRDGDRYFLNYDALDACDTILVHNRGALFNEAVYKFKAHGKRIIYLLDANLFALPVKNRLYSYYDALRPRIEGMMEHADLVVTASSELQKQWGARYKMQLLAAGVDPDLWTAMPPKPDNDKVVIAFFGTEHDFDSLGFIRPVLDHIQNKHGDRCEIKIFGFDVPQNKLQQFAAFDPLSIKVPTYKHWVAYLQNIHADIALLPSREDRYSKERVDLRVLEYAMSRIAIIASDTVPFSDFIEDGVEGCLCGPNMQEWRRAVDTLITDAKKRRTMTEHAYRKVTSAYTSRHNAASWHDLLESLGDIPESTLQRESFDQMHLEWKKHEIISLERYPAWMQRRRFRSSDIAVWAKEAEHWKILPHFMLFVHVDEVSIEHLAATIDSLGNQIYPKWTLIVLSSMPSPSDAFHSNERLEWVQSPNPLTDDINTLVHGNALEWIALIRSGDLFEPHALANYVQVLQEENDYGLIYCDHGEINASNVMVNPQFKPDINPDMLRSYDYIGGAYFVHRDFFVWTGGLDALPESIALYDLVLKAVDALEAKQIAHIDELLWHRRGIRVADEAAALMHTASKVVLNRHLQRNGLNAEVIDGTLPGTHRVIYHFSAQPAVSVIVPTRDRRDLLEVSIGSLIEKTLYDNYEIIIINNQSKEPETLAYFEELKRLGTPRVRVIDYDTPFNYSEAINIGAAAATGEYLLFMNNDTEVLHGDWMHLMLSYAMREDVGVVGPRLLFGNGTVQHAGVILGLGGAANHIYSGEDPEVEGYMKRLQIDQNYSAVTGAVQMVSKADFNRVNGYNAEDYVIYYSDVDFCLKLIDLGLKVVWTPYVTLHHHESQTVKSGDPAALKKRSEIFRSDQRMMEKMWFELLLHDPAFNANLDNTSTNALINIDDIPHWNRYCQHTPKIWGIPRAADGGGEYRIIAPLRAMDRAGIVQTHIGWNYYGLASIVMRYQPDVILLQTPLHDYQLEFIKAMRRHFKGKILFEIDDLLTEIPRNNPAYGQGYSDVGERLAQAVNLSDRLVVSTQPLKEAYGTLASETRVVPNCLSETIWGGLTSKRHAGAKPRVGWAGSPFHTGDLQIIAEVVKILKDDVEWVFMGMIPEGCRSYVHEYHPPVPLEVYPEKLAMLNLDVALVPLEINTFNEAKSNLRLLEMGILGWPVICSDAYPYRGAPVTIVENSTEAWLKAIKEKLNNLERTVEEGDTLRAWVLENYILEKNLETIAAAYV